jgi:uncharacterized protein YndB with AHSA1/START domain
MENNMAVLKKTLIGLLMFFVLLILIGFILPSEFKVQRSISVEAPAENVYANVVDLRKWRAWGVWFKRDPNMDILYSGPESAVGMKSEWVSEQEGSGEMVVIAIEPNQRFIYSLYFPDMDMGSTGEFVFTEEQGRTEVTWMDYGDVGSNPVNRYFALFMDNMIGSDFEIGLENLKLLSESQIVQPSP